MARQPECARERRVGGLHGGREQERGRVRAVQCSGRARGKNVDVFPHLGNF